MGRECAMIDEPERLSALIHKVEGGIQTAGARARDSLSGESELGGI